MRTIYKIFILLGVSLAIAAAICVFYNTQVAMPEKPQTNNPHQDYLRSRSLEIIGLKHGGKNVELDSAKFLIGDTLENRYQRQLLSLSRFRDEQLIGDSIYNQQLDTLIWAYSQAFVNQAHCIFKEREWSYEDRDFLTSRAAQLMEMADLSGNKVLALHNGLENGVEKVTASCGDYVKATTLLTYDTYDGYGNVTERIDEINEIIKNGNLSLNTQLISEMNAYPGKMGDCHYSYLEDLAQKVSNWENSYLSSVLSYFDTFTSEVNNYSHSDGLYGSPHPKDITELESNVTNSKNEAADNLCSLYVDGYSSDISRSIDSSSGSISFSVETNHPDGYSLDDTSSSLFSISSHTSSTIDVSYNANSSYSTRSDYFFVNAGNKTIKVQLNQEGAANNPTYNTGYINGKSTKDWTSTHSGRITVAVSNNDNCDLDLTILDDYGDVLAEDKSSTKCPSLTFNSPGHYTIRIYNYSESGCNYELREY